MTAWIPILPAIGLLGLVSAVYTFLAVKKLPDGDAQVREIAGAIHTGAMVFLKREYQVISIFAVVVFAALAYLISLYTGLAFLGGVFCSMGAGWFGMEAATMSSSRTLHAAKEGGISEALNVAFRGGSVMGITVAALGLVGVGVIYLFTQDPIVINGFAMGASSVALFARVGGGIYTKAADVGADIVGKTEAGIPEDDPRNPGVIADNVGDNVGDTAGMGADLFESYVSSIIAVIVIGVTLEDPARHMILPLVLAAAGLLCSLAGVGSIRVLKRLEPQNALRGATYVAGGLFTLSALIILWGLFGKLNLFWSIFSGMFAGILIGLESEYFTSGPPVRALARTAESGPATVIISGMAIGFESLTLPILTLSGGIWIAYTFGGLYGIALSALGMLSTIGIVMSTDSYGPIADNAGGIAEMSHASPEVRKVTDKLDALGNTTAAIGKGFAIGSAALTSLALFSAFQETAGLKAINLTEVHVVIGLFLGALMPCVVAAMTMKAVGRAANKMVHEIRRQFREIIGLMEGTAKADSAACIDIVTKEALREMVAPGIAAVLAPLIVGKLLGVEALGGFLAGATLTGVILGIMMSNAGAAWDNAKKHIEAGHYGGKGSDAHKAAVIGDTVGDPFKDTSGPSMNILIKLMAIVSLVFLPALM